MTQHDADAHPFGEAFDVAWYVRTYQDVPRDLAVAARHFVEHGLAEGRKFHPLFDAEWYLRQNPDVAASTMTPTRHFLEHGLAEGRSPHPLFDPAWYQRANPGVEETGLSPFEHFLRYGLRDDLSPHPFFDPDWYRCRNPNFPGSGLPAIIHYLEHGAAAGSSPHAMFDPDWYARQNPDVAAGHKSPSDHFLSYGFAEGRNPHPLFDALWYLCKNPDVAASELQPFQHFICYGLKEGRSPHPIFDRQWYIANYADVLGISEEPFLFFLKTGFDRGDLPGPLFDKKFYLEQYPDLTNFESDGLQHYIQYGYAEGRIPNRIFDEDWYKDVNSSLIKPSQPPFLHFIRFGQFIPTDPHPLFHSTWYARTYRSFLDGETPFSHYLRVGHNKPNRAFDTLFVYNQLRSLNSQGSPLVSTDCEDKSHLTTIASNRTYLEAYLLQQKTHSIQPNLLFDPNYYKFTYPDVWHSKLDPLTHFLQYGIAEGRRTSRDFDPTFYKLQVGLKTCAAAFWSALEEGIDPKHRPSTAFLPAWDNHIIEALKERLNADIPSILIINHFGGGGTSKNISDLCEFFGRKANFLILTPGRNGFIAVELWDKSIVALIFDKVDAPSRLSEILSELPIDRVHVHHALGLNDMVPRIVEKLDRPYDVTLHDTYFITPNPLFRHGAHARDAAGLDHAMRSSALDPLDSSEVGSTNIEVYRDKYRLFLRHADRLIAPSHFIASVYTGCDPILNPIVISNLDPAQQGFPIKKRVLKRSDQLRIGVIGDLASYKGANRVQQCALVARARQLPLQFTVIGEASHFVRGAGVSVIGRYDDSDLPKLLVRFGIDAVWLPYEAPESYSYVLSSALRSSLPVIITDVGCFPERTEGLSQTFMVSVESSPASWLDLMLAIRSQIIDGSTFEASCVPERHAFYEFEYLQPPIWEQGD